MANNQCPLHGLELSIKKISIVTLGKKFDCVIGECPKCRSKYINRKIFPNCNNFKVDNQEYCFHTGLNQRYTPSKSETIVLQEQTHPEDISHDRKSKEVIPRQEARNLQDDVKLHSITNASPISNKKQSNIYYTNTVPPKCFNDQTELLLAKNISFTNPQSIAYRCPKCNSIYIIGSDRHTDSNRSQEIPYDVKQLLVSKIPVLKKGIKRCPFCKTGSMKVASVKCMLNKSYGNEIISSLPIFQCQKCGAIFAKSSTIEEISSIDFIIKTVNPSDYFNATSMMSDIIIKPIAEPSSAKKLTDNSTGENSQELVPNSISSFKHNLSPDNLSAKNQVVLVYTNKCHCQRCKNRLKKDTIVNRTAIVNTISGQTEKINVMYCQGCGQYFINLTVLQYYKDLYGGLLMECSTDIGTSSDALNALGFASDSVLSRCGYSVKQGISDSYRHTILSYVLDSGKATKYEIIELINSFIKIRQSQSRYSDACQRWREDILFVSNHRINQQEFVSGLTFQKRN